LIALMLAGCGSPAVEVSLPDVILRVEPASGRIAILHPDRSPILDGLPGGSVDKGAMPHVGFAWRDAAPTWMEQYGSFLVSDDGVPEWQGAHSFSHVQKSSDGISFDVDGGGSGSLRQLGDGTVAIVYTPPAGARTSAAFRCAADERFLGFGAMPMDVEHRGATVPLFVSEQGIGRVPTDDPPGAWFETGTRHQSYFPVPFFLSSHNYGVRAETQVRSTFAMCSETDDTIRIEAWEPRLELHVYYGAGPLDVLGRHTDEVGRPPLPPAWAFAPWNDAIFGSANVRKIAGELRNNAIPSSVIWTEDWAGGENGSTGYRLTYDWSVSRTLYPDAEQVASDLHVQGFKWLAYFNTFAETDGDHYQTQYLVHHSDGTPYVMDSVRFGKKTGMVDLGNLAARAWMAQSLKAALAIGFDGWMADYGEWLPVDGAPNIAEHDAYPNEWQRLNESVLGDDNLVFVRSGYTGSQPIAHQIVWGGDQTTDFDPGDGMPTVLPIALGLGVAGLPYFGSDIGGYATLPNHPTGTKELFFRWSVLGALSPVMRTHHGSMAPNNWEFDSDAETLAHYGRWARVHMKLYPYLNAIAQQASATGAPMMRELALEFPTDPRAWTTADEYLLGRALLVAPIAQSGTANRTVYFPSGNWFAVFTKPPPMPMPMPMPPQILSAGDHDVLAPLGELPVYARAGSILPLLPDGVTTLVGNVPTAREVWIYAGGADDVQEPNGPRYQLSADPPSQIPTMFVWNDTALQTCAVPPVWPCGSIDATNHVATATVSGNGVLALDSVKATLGNAAGRVFTVKMYW
jgi:alpha-glucosidase (family GH31 glycosyl hydrolase)